MNWFSSVIKSCPTCCNIIDCSTTGLPIPHYLPEFAQVHVHWIGDVIQPSHLQLPSSPFAFSLSQHQVFPNELTLHIRWWRILELKLRNKFFQWIFMDFFPLGLTGFISLAVQGTFKSHLEHHNSKESTLWHSAFFRVQLSHPFMIAVKP